MKRKPAKKPPLDGGAVVKSDFDREVAAMVKDGLLDAKLAKTGVLKLTDKGLKEAKRQAGN